MQINLIRLVAAGCLLFKSTAVVNDDYQLSCPAIQCLGPDQTDPYTKCAVMKVGGTELTVRDKQCSEHEECVILDGQSGYCLSRLTDERKQLYPGEYCDILEEFTTCAFGPQM